MDSSTKKTQGTGTSSAKTTKAAGKGRTFKQMIVAGKFSSRTLQENLRMASRTVKKAEIDPSVLSLGDVYRLADLMKENVDTVLRDIIAEINQLPPELHPVKPKK
ncbi:hypothetical protein [Hymenobacter sp. DG01]|uniref:hypothetical protein n=1 Tax=Hymenobacter sp. DG01 TaxID=2584940 RepID=UPI0011212271|nr:hypothetical protein [Hymenobacter sp. DG01]